MRKLLTLLVAALFSSLAVDAPAQAGPLYYTHYTVNLLPDTLSVNGIVKFESTAHGGGASWPDFLHGGVGTQTIDQVFGSDEPRTEALLLGMSYDGVNDIVSEPQMSPGHIVMFMSNDAAALAVGQSFDSVFSGYSESDIIHALEVVGLIGTPPLTPAEFDAQYDILAGFAESVRQFSTGSGLINGWFAIPDSQAIDPGHFTAVMFSNGTSIGSGTVTQTARDSAVVPEPSTFALFGLGGLGSAFIVYRRRSVAAI